jgi:tetratricopeptide (TPR) repeat protein
LHPNPKSAVVVGLGAGLTLGGVAADESVERIVVVEIEPSVRGGAQVFADLHDDALADPRVELVWQDGRNYLQTTKEKFDVITADPIHPWTQGAAYLYTTEYYSMVADHLKAGGIMCQWLPLYELAEEDLQSVVAAFVESFEHTTLWQATDDALLIGGNAPLAIDLELLERRMRQPRVSRQLARVGLGDPLSLLAEYTMDREGMMDFARGATVNTDDNLFLEFSSPHTVLSSVNRENVLLIDSGRRNASEVVRGLGAGFGTRADLESALDRFRIAKSKTIQADQKWSQVNYSPSKAGFQELASTFQAILEDAPNYQRAKFLLSVCLTGIGKLMIHEGQIMDALPWFRRALEFDPGNATANLQIGASLAKRGEDELAVEHFSRSLDRRPRFTNSLAGAGRSMMALGRFTEALAAYRKLAALLPDRVGPARRICECLRELNRPEEATVACEAADEIYQAGKSVLR